MIFTWNVAKFSKVVGNFSRESALFFKIGGSYVLFYNRVIFDIYKAIIRNSLYIIYIFFFTGLSFNNLYLLNYGL